MKGQYSWRAALGWLLVYAGLVLVPLAVASIDAPAPRGWLVDTGAALGLLGLGMLAVQSLFSGRLSGVAARFGADNVLHFHRHMGMLAVGLVLAHPALLILGDPSFARFLDPRVDAMRAISLAVLLAGLCLTLATSLWRLSLGLSYETWRLVHGLAAVLILVLGLGHGLMVDHYLDATWKNAVVVGLVGAMIYLPFHTRLVRTWLQHRRPWLVESVTPERGETWTVRLRPDGHDGMDFLPGQYAWFTLGPSPMAIQQHPFSFSSAPARDSVSFSARVVGDFTDSLPRLEPGTRAWVEGPLGAFVPDPDPKTGLFLVAGGIGITPFMSMLEQFAERGDSRPIRLVYANPNLEEAAFHERLEALEAILDLRVVHVPEDPPPDWSGETGHVDLAMLERLAPPPEARVQYMMCGPEPLMDAVESGLRQLGVDWRRIFSERFEIV